jgi:hypothetical protein
VDTPPVERPPVAQIDSESLDASDTVADAYRALVGTAGILNAVSDELGKSIGVLDAALKKLNLGVAVWVRIDKNKDGPDGEFNHHLLGYAKVNSRWGVALATTEGNYGWLPDSNDEHWLFNDAPRILRIEAVEHLPALLTKMTEKASEVADSIRKQSEMARDIANAIDIASKTSDFKSR